MHARVRPLSDWDGLRTKPSMRRQRPFSAEWRVTLATLFKELDYLKARDIVIEAGFAEHHLRLDGWPRANAPQPRDPACRLSFDSRYGPLIYQSDSCDHWQDNVRSIALGLEALRAVDRYGVTKRGQQYQGWAAIGGATVSAPPEQPLGNPWQVIRELAQQTDRDPQDGGRSIMLAKRYSHPDHVGGSHEKWLLLERALRQLGFGL